MALAAKVEILILGGNVFALCLSYFLYAQSKLALNKINGSDKIEIKTTQVSYGKRNGHGLLQTDKKFGYRLAVGFEVYSMGQECYIADANLILSIGNSAYTGRRRNEEGVIGVNNNQVIVNPSWLSVNNNTVTEKPAYYSALFVFEKIFTQEEMLNFDLSLTVLTTRGRKSTHKINASEL